MTKRSGLMITLVFFALFAAGCMGSLGGQSLNPYTVSGTVLIETEEGKVGLEGVTISVATNGIGSNATKTDGEGNWTLVDVRGNVGIRPEKEGYIFEPHVFHTIKAVKGIQFLATFVGEFDPSDDQENEGDKEEEETYSVRGIVVFIDEHEMEVGLGGVELTLEAEGGVLKTTQTEEDGTWEFEGLVGTVTIVPRKEGYTFEPATQGFFEHNENAKFVATVDTLEEE